jgi:hypothetical protein
MALVHLTAGMQVCQAEQHRTAWHMYGAKGWHQAAVWTTRTRRQQGCQGWQLAV